jgi:SulP family sulfate permease
VTRRPRRPVLRGVLPSRRSELAADLLAGVALAAIAISQALGYAKIAGMPVVTGLYTLLLPMAVFAILGSSRHLVVAADSATAAMLAAALAGMAAPASAKYVHLAGLAALLTGVLLLLARMARLGFLANFLSRTILLGFLASVGIQVAIAQLPGMLGLTVTSTRTISRLVHTSAALPRADLATVAVSAAVVAVVLTAGKITHRIPGALIAIVASIIVSRSAGLAGPGVAILRPVPRGLPSLGPPAFGWHHATRLLGPAVSMSVVILAQSAATARAYAAKHEETFSADTDLVGLGAANVSPTQTQMADGAGGRSQLAQLTTGAVVLFVLLFATRPLAYLPIAALAAVVFFIAVRLVDLGGMRRILAVRREEFAIAVLTAAAVVVLGVQDGIVLAAAASIIDHRRHTYHPTNSVLVKSPNGHWHATPGQPGARTEPGLVVYRFGTSLYYANASRLAEDVAALTGHGGPLRWMVLDGAAIDDVDYTAASVLTQVITKLRDQHVRLIVTSAVGRVRQQLDRYGISARLRPRRLLRHPGRRARGLPPAIRRRAMRQAQPRARPVPALSIALVLVRRLARLDRA